MGSWTHDISIYERDINIVLVLCKIVVFHLLHEYLNMYIFINYRMIH